jgi:hypothetical protein
VFINILKKLAKNIAEKKNKQTETKTEQRTRPEREKGISASSADRSVVRGIFPFVRSSVQPVFILQDREKVKQTG